MMRASVSQLLSRVSAPRIFFFQRSVTLRSFNSTATPPSAPYDVLFCGTDTFASASLSALLTHSVLYSSLQVLTPPDVAQKWGGSRMKVSPVKQIALKHGLPHQDVPPSGMVDYEPPRSIHGNPGAVLITCSFGHLIPDKLLDAFPNPWQRINIHPSLLPHLRGAAPIQWALARQLTESGVTIQTLEKGKFDTGRIISQEALAFPPVDRPGAEGFLEVEAVMAARAASLLIRTLNDLPTFFRHSWVQDEAQRTYAPKLKATHSAIRWDRWSAPEIAAREKAFAYLYPLSTTLHPPSGRPVAVTIFDTSSITTAKLHAQSPDIAGILSADSTPPGSAIYSAALDALVIKTQGNDMLVVKTLKVASKKGKRAQEWWKGYRDRAHPRTGFLHFQ